MRCVSVVSVPVSDQDRAKAFYVDMLGFEVIADRSFGEGMRWVQVGPAGAQASLTLVTWFAEMPAGSLRELVLDTDDIHRDYAELLDRGAEVAGPPSEQPGGVFCFVTDPDGNVIGLHQSVT